MSDDKKYREFDRGCMKKQEAKMFEHLRTYLRPNGKLASVLHGNQGSNYYSEIQIGDQSLSLEEAEALTAWLPKAVQKLRNLRGEEAHLGTKSLDKEARTGAKS